MTLTLDAAPDVDLEPVILDQLEFDVPCMQLLLDGVRCQEPARWIYLWSCSCATFFCDRHHQRAQDLIASEGIERMTFYCDEPHHCVITLLSVELLRR